MDVKGISDFRVNIVPAGAGLAGTAQGAGAGGMAGTAQGAGMTGAGGASVSQGLWGCSATWNVTGSGLVICSATTQLLLAINCRTLVTASPAA